MASFPCADQVEDCLGVGSTSAVLRATDNKSGLVVALKVRNTVVESDEQKLANELGIYRRILSRTSPASKWVS